jgi:HSP20 family molecular chaperone IbpA
MDTARISLPQGRPAADIIELSDGFVIVLDLPGVSRESLSVELRGTELVVRGRALLAREPGRKPLHLEFGDAEFVRSFTVAHTVDREHIRATFRHGQLELFLPKSTHGQPRTIPVASADTES